MAALAAASAKSGLSDIVKTRSRSARKRAFDPKQLTWIALLCAGAIFVGWLCVRAATVEMLGRRNPATAAAFAPRDPRVVMGTANLEFRVRQGIVTPGTSAQVVAALQRAPLAYDPFFFAGLAALVRGDEAAAQRMIAEARARNPRSRMARLIYLDQSLRTGRVAEAAVEIAAISRLVPETSRLLIPELARYASDPKTAPALIDALRPDPKLRNAVLEHMAEKSADTDAILRLAASGPPPADLKGTPEWQNRLLAKLVDKGEIARARTLWAQFSGAAPPPPGAVYDGAFRGAPGAAPFNWRFSETAAGVAERTKAPALQVEYYGRADGELASQLLQLAPGRHLLSFVASGNTPASGGTLAWTITCIGGNAPIWSLPIKQLTYSPKRLGASFAVPPNCPAQWLRLTGTSAEFPAAHSVTIADLQVRKAS